jgi:putative flippase GtrA
MWKTFSRAQVASLAATVIDFGALTLWVEVFHQFYAYGVAIGALMGAVTNFLINRYWSFEAGASPIVRQAGRYAMVSAGSLILNTVGVYLITERFGVYYMSSKLAIAFAIGIFYNYPLHRYFVYHRDLPERVPGV